MQIIKKNLKKFKHTSYKSIYKNIYKYRTDICKEIVIEFV